MPQSIFSEVPENFFFPLASKHRKHYAELLLRYYRLFETYSTGVERELVLSTFEEYLTEESGMQFNGAALELNVPEHIRKKQNRDTAGKAQNNAEMNSENGIHGDNGAGLAADAEADLGPETDTAVPADAEAPEDDLLKFESANPRSLASLFLRRLISYGWMSEEILADYTQVINITMWARPYYAAMLETVKGLQVEYESHVIGIYTSICSEAAADQGHHAVLNAMDHTRRLIESLKVLSQNIKTHIERIFHEDAEVSELLHIHYDLYMQEIVDKAYNRLKTSDNLSKYRPPIIKAVNGFLQNETWLEKTAGKLAVIRNRPRREVRVSLTAMLKEIRDELKHIDPILEEIDDKNRQYSRISTEKIKARLYADSSLQGKVKTIMKGIQEHSSAYTELRPKLFNASFLIKTSLYTRKFRRDAETVIAKPELTALNTDELEAEMRLRIQNQLNPEKIRKFLDRVCRADGSPTPASEIISSMDDFIRVVYAAAYAEGREGRFPYRIRWEGGLDRSGRFEFRRHLFLSVSEKRMK